MRMDYQDLRHYHDFCDRSLAAAWLSNIINMSCATENPRFPSCSIRMNAVKLLENVLARKEYWQPLWTYNLRIIYRIGYHILINWRKTNTTHDFAWLPGVWACFFHRRQSTSVSKGHPSSLYSQWGVYQGLDCWPQLQMLYYYVCLQCNKKLSSAWTISGSNFRKLSGRYTARMHLSFLPTRIGNYFPGYGKMWWTL